MQHRRKVVIGMFSLSVRIVSFEQNNSRIFEEMKKHGTLEWVSCRYTDRFDDVFTSLALRFALFLFPVQEFQYFSQKSRAFNFLFKLVAKSLSQRGSKSAFCSLLCNKRGPAFTFERVRKCIVFSSALIGDSRETQRQKLTGRERKEEGKRLQVRVDHA